MPSRNDNYEFVRHLGHGGMATVELWRHKLCGLAEHRARSQWGIESTHPELAVAKRVYVGEMDEEAKADAHREVAVLKKLSHPHVVRYFGSWVDSQSEDLIIVQEYCEDGDLGRFIKERQKRQDPIAAAQVVRWLAQVAHALQYCHKRARILHRDLKPRNIFLSHGCTQTHLGDFGIAKQISRTQSLCQTYIGTQVYMSPEIIRMQKYGLKCDVWSLGVTLYEMCTLKRPFESRDPLQVIQAITSPAGPPRFPSETGHPAELEELCMAMLEKSPEARPGLSQLLGSSTLLREAALQVEREVGWTDPGGQDSLVPAAAGTAGAAGTSAAREPPLLDGPGGGRPGADAAKVLTPAASPSLLPSQPPPPPPGAPSRWTQLPLPAEREVTRRSVKDAAQVSGLMELTVRKRELTALLVQAQRAFSLTPVPEEGASRPRSSCSSHGGCGGSLPAEPGACAGAAEAGPQPCGPPGPSGLSTGSGGGAAGSSGAPASASSCTGAGGVPRRAAVQQAELTCLDGPGAQESLPAEQAAAEARRLGEGAGRAGAAAACGGASSEEDIKQNAAIIGARLQCIEVLNEEEPDPVELTSALRQVADFSLAEEECGRALILHTHRLRMQAEDVVSQDAAPLAAVEKATEMLEAAQHVPQGAGVAKASLSQAQGRLQRAQREQGQLGLRCMCGNIVRFVSVRREASLPEAMAQIARRLGKPTCALTLSWQSPEGHGFIPAIELNSEEAWRGCLAQSPSGTTIELAVKMETPQAASSAVHARRRPLPQTTTPPPQPMPQPGGSCSSRLGGSAARGRALSDGQLVRRSGGSQPPPNCDGPPRRSTAVYQSGRQLPILSGNELAPRRQLGGPQPPHGSDVPPRRSPSSPQLAASGDAFLRGPSSSPLPHAAGPPAPGVDTKVDLQKVSRVFQRFDSSGRGEISFVDLQRVLRMLIPSWTDKNLHAFMRAVDSNGDGRIQYPEFASWLMRSDDGLDEARRAVLAEPQAAGGPAFRRGAVGRRPLLMQGKSLLAS